MIQDKPVRKVNFKMLEFAYCPGLVTPSGDKLQDLASLAAEEQWYFNGDPQGELRILFSYIHHTFNRIESEGKIEESDDGLMCCFNTGLHTKHYEEIFGVFQKNRVPGKQPWFLKEFLPKSKVGFPKLPERANYFEDISDIIFDYRLDIRIDIQHILDEDTERKNRLPAELRNVQNLEGAVNMTIKRIKSNYRLAIPQFYFGTGKIQLLIPLFSSNPEDNRVKAVIPIEKHSSGQFYQGHTCLNMRQAHNNARLIAKLDSDWLKPSAVAGVPGDEEEA